jgi:hypothetical protein
MLDESVYRQANEVMREYGAAPIEMPRSKASMRFYLRDMGAVSRHDPIKWRIKGVLPQLGIGALFGPSGSAKTFLAIDMALAISEGKRWFGYRTVRCPIVYVCLEGEAGLSNRIRAYRRKTHLAGDVYFVTQPFDLLQSIDVPDLATSIKECDAVGGVVIIDTLNRAAPGMDENSSADMGRAIASAKQLQSLIGGLVLLVHHTGKDATKGMRGHSSLFAALDAAIEVNRTGEQREWRVSKSKDGSDSTSHPFKLEIVDLGIDEDGDLISSCVVSADSGPTMAVSKPLTHSQQQGMDSFMSAASETLGHDDKRARASVVVWRNAFNRICTADTADGKKKAFQRVRIQLVEMGKLVFQDDYYFLANPPGHGT